jgi:hypothetical protein
LIQSVASASRASCAVSTASRAVRQPAVLGQQPDAVPGDDVDERTGQVRVGRRIDTVHSSAAGGGQDLLHDAHRRRAAGAQDQPRVQLLAGQHQDVVGLSPSLYGGEQLDGLSIMEYDVGPPGARRDRTVDGGGDAPVAAQPPFDEVGQGQPVGHSSGVTVDW